MGVVVIDPTTQQVRRIDRGQPGLNVVTSGPGFVIVNEARQLVRLDLQTLDRKVLVDLSDPGLSNVIRAAQP